MEKTTQINRNLILQKELGIKIVAMSVAIGGIYKTGFNASSNYKFVSYDKLTEKMEKDNLFSKFNLAIVPTVEKVEERDLDVIENKSIKTRSIVWMVFEVTDTETGYTRLYKFVGADTDTGGKSLQQAITQCVKYFYFKVFKIPGLDDSDSKTTSVQSKGGVKLVSVFPKWEAIIIKYLHEGKMAKELIRDIEKKIGTKLTASDANKIYNLENVVTNNEITENKGNI